MNNLEKIVNSASKQNFSTLNKQLNKEFSGRIFKRIESMKKDIASNLFQESNQNK